MSDELERLRPIWKAHGGEWHGPKVETWSIPEARMTSFMAEALRPALTDPDYPAVFHKLSVAAIPEKMRGFALSDAQVVEIANAACQQIDEYRREIAAIRATPPAPPSSPASKGNANE